MMLGTPYQNPISQFNIAETPRTDASSQKNMLMSTPKKDKSPKTQLMKDVTMSMDSAHLSTPINNKGMRK